MGEVRLYAIGIDEVRDLFSGSPDHAERLRRLAVAAFPPAPVPQQRGLLSKLGPMVRRPLDAPVVYPGVPTGRDLDDLIHGRDLPPDRLSAGWALVRLWLDDTAWGRLDLTLDEARLDDLDFALSRAGVDPRFAVRKLFNRQAALPLKELPGQVTGYVRHAHALAMADAVRSALPSLTEEQAALAEPLVAWLGSLEGWAAEAETAARAVPDVVAVWQSSDAG